jgi:hypothetical protein
VDLEGMFDRIAANEAGLEERRIEAANHSDRLDEVSSRIHSVWYCRWDTAPLMIRDVGAG